MATFRLNGAGAITLSVQALNALEIAGGVLTPQGPNPGPSIVGKQSRAGIIEWQVPADKSRNYLMQVQMPHLGGVPMNQHKLERKVSQWQPGRDNKILHPAAENPKTASPQNRLSNDQLLYHALIEFD